MARVKASGGMPQASRRVGSHVVIMASSTMLRGAMVLASSRGSGPRSSEGAMQVARLRGGILLYVEWEAMMKRNGRR
jgi:hypothetical protein